MKPGEQFQHPNGKTYEAVKGAICDDCAFVNSDYRCAEAPPCTAGTNFGISIIFKEVKPKKESHENNHY